MSASRRCAALGLAARYVSSGYLLTKPPPGQPRRCWVRMQKPCLVFRVGAALRPGVDCDPTNNVLPSEGHVTAGWGRDYGDVSPINGIVVGGGEQEIEVGVDVIPAELLA